jgi:hypothetical protein
MIHEILFIHIAYYHNRMLYVCYTLMECIRCTLSCVGCCYQREEPVLQAQYDAMSEVEIIPYPLDSARQME